MTRRRCSTSNTPAEPPPLTATTPTLTRLLAWRPGLLAWNTVRGTCVYGVRLAAQALYFLLLARWLGPDQFGYFVGVWVLAGFLATFASLGYPVLVLKTMALEPEQAPDCLARGIRVLAFAAPLLGATFFGITLAYLPPPPSLLVPGLFALSEIVMVPLLSLVAASHQGSEHLGRSHAILASLWVLRLFSLGMLSVVSVVNLTDVAAIHCMATLLAVIAWLVIDRRHIGRIGLAKLRYSPELATGSSFALSSAALIAYTELNQSLVLGITGAAAAGLLAVAYKIVTLLSTPLAVLCQALAPRLLRSAQEGTGSLSATVRALVAPMALYALGCCLAILLGASFISWMFGQEYSEAGRIARALSILPLFTAVRLLSVYALLAFDNQRARVVAEVSCLAGGITLNMALISSYGLWGAVVGSLVVEGLTAWVLAAVAWHKMKKQRLTDMRH